MSSSYSEVTHLEDHRIVSRSVRTGHGEDSLASMSLAAKSHSISCEFAN